MDPLPGTRARDPELVIVGVERRRGGDGPKRISGRAELDVVARHGLRPERRADVEGEFAVGLLLELAAGARVVKSRYQRTAPAESNAKAKRAAPPSESAVRLSPEDPVPVVVMLTPRRSSGSGPPAKARESERAAPPGPTTSATPPYVAPLRRPSTGTTPVPAMSGTRGVESARPPASAYRIRAESAWSAWTSTKAARALAGLGLGVTDATRG